MKNLKNKKENSILLAVILCMAIVLCCSLIKNADIVYGQAERENKVTEEDQQRENNNDDVFDQNTSEEETGPDSDIEEKEEVETEEEMSRQTDQEQIEPEPVDNDQESMADTWSGDISESFAGGTGSKEDPYLISNGEELAFFAQQVNAGNNFKNMFIELANDLRLNEIIEFEEETGEAINIDDLEPFTAIGDRSNNTRILMDRIIPFMVYILILKGIIKVCLALWLGK